MAQHIADYYKYCHDNGKKFSTQIKQSLRQQLNQSHSFDFPAEVNCVLNVGFIGEMEPLLSGLVDDGDETRTGRKLLMDEEMRVCGVGAVKMNNCGLVCGVCLLTTQVLPK